MLNRIELEEELKREIVSQLGRGVPEDDIIFEICQGTGMTWAEAESLVFSMTIYRSRQIARRQMVILTALGLSTILAGSVLIGLFIQGMVGHLRTLSGGATPDTLKSIGIVLGLIINGQFAGGLVFGAAMIAGGFFGLVRAVKQSL